MSDFIGMLQKTKADIQSQDQQSSLTDITKVRESWLSVEGTVVAQSATVYNDTERDMVTVNAMISSRNYNGATKVLDKMVGYLTPLASKTSYTIGLLTFLAVFREGTETVLFVIGMVNQISLQQLLLGILIGIGILAIAAYLMLVVGVKLPMRPFFLVSSLIVFYLCFKLQG
ncbi:FTR1 family protein [Aneurinibacillus sp. Ricciae_BoGa-3]|uniref:FTR1 family protein n=1 Tax=Aneurinibacillus sp. Ricciae_BoGa-3 TaxID=3022697 RepID=UPI0023425CB2|nr:FTR1 family protein [Aneurinibacillus sp. Ricciae_BoGa-3]WCK53268.1 FTR1 family protein [Aneurinibacillus sp. Ricciae_BoGa-3]